MANYKASYKVLSQQGPAIKEVAKLVDTYAERVSQIKSKLGNDDMLAAVRQNLDKLREQLGESRAVLNTAGEFLTKTVESYTTTEGRQVKRIDEIKAHKRDFYKNPVSVPSAGSGAAGAGAGVAAAAAASATPMSAQQAAPASQGSAASKPSSSFFQNVQKPSATNMSMPSVADTIASKPVNAMGGAAGAFSGAAGAAAGAVAGAIGAGAAAGAAAGAIGTGVVGAVKHFKGKDKDPSPVSEEPKSDNGYDPASELEKARQRVKNLQD